MRVKTGATHINKIIETKVSKIYSLVMHQFLKDASINLSLQKNFKPIGNQIVMKLSSK
jgi:hypothetical protein